MLARILLAFVQDAEVVRLRDTNKLTVVALGPHHSLVVQLVHGGRYAKTATNQTKILFHFQIFNTKYANQVSSFEEFVSKKKKLGFR